MATFTFTKSFQCSGGNHLHVQVSDGVKTRTIEVDTTYLRTPITDEEMQAVFKVLTRAALAQLNIAQANQKLNAGFTVVMN